MNVIDHLMMRGNIWAKWKDWVYSTTEALPKTLEFRSFGVCCETPL